MAEYEQGKARKTRPDDCATDAGSRFNYEVPIEVINITLPELIGSDADQYKIIDTKITRKLAKLPTSYVVLEYHLPAIKKIDSDDVRTACMLDQVLDSSIADVSLLVGLLIDKSLYHNPLHREHQKLTHAGITVARSSLTNWVKRSIELLRPVVQVMLNHVLESKVLAMDETPIKAGRKHQGKMKQAYFWPVYGEDH